MIISVEYDNVLTKTTIQLIIRSLIESGVLVYLITSRDEFPKDASVNALCEFVGISKNHQFFSNGAYKSDLIKRLNVTMHLDAKHDEVQVINLMTKCKAVNINIKK